MSEGYGSRYDAKAERKAERAATTMTEPMSEIESTLNLHPSRLPSAEQLASIGRELLAEVERLKGESRLNELMFEQVKQALGTNCYGDEGLVTRAKRIVAQLNTCQENLAQAESIAENNYTMYQRATEKCPDCGGHAWDTRLESNQRFCRLCDMQGRARDAEQMEREHRDTLADLRQQLATATAERDGWIESARQFSCNEDFYRNIVHEVGEMFGVASKTSDDGSIQDDVLALKVPELVREAKQQLAITSEAAKAMEWLEADPTLRVWNGHKGGNWHCGRDRCIACGPTPTAAILAAKAASQPAATTPGATV